MAAYFRAADIYLHAARADTFPNAVLESLACGTPVVATPVGGIPEQVRSLSAENEPMEVLVPSGDAVAMAAAVERLFTEPNLLQRLGAAAAKDASKRFALETMVTPYLDWYESLRR